MTGKSEKRDADAKFLGALLHSARKGMRLTLASVALEAFGNADRKGYISDLEQGKLPNVGTEQVRRICTFLGIDRRRVPDRYKWPNGAAFDGSEAEARFPVSESGRLRGNADWDGYREVLASQINLPALGTSIPLARLYVPLRVSYQDTLGNLAAEGFENPQLRTEESSRRSRTVIDYAAGRAIKWIFSANKQSDAIRIVRGGPGSGKSTFAKFLAQLLIRKPIDPISKAHCEVLFIPLQAFDDQLPSFEVCVDRYLDDVVSKNLRLSDLINALDPNQKLLLIFDGLDELSTENVASREHSVEFIKKVQKLLSKYNQSSIRMLSIIIGRDVAVHGIEEKAGLSQNQLLRLLPFRHNLISNVLDLTKMAGFDHRLAYWERWLAAQGLDQVAFPDKLDQAPLSELSNEPMLMHLICTTNAFEVNSPTISKKNQLYELIIGRTISNWHNRGAAETVYLQPDLATIRKLELLAATSWLDGGRTTSGSRFQEVVQIVGASEEFPTKDDVFSDLDQAVVAFYFTPSGTFDEMGISFTHKSFSDYLAGRYIYGSLLGSAATSASIESEEAIRIASLLSRGEITPELAEILSEFAEDSSIDEASSLRRLWSDALKSALSGEVFSGVSIREACEVLTICRSASAMKHRSVDRIASGTKGLARRSLGFLSQQDRETDWQWRHKFTSLVPVSPRLSLKYLNHIDFSGENFDSFSISSAYFFGSNFSKCSIRGGNFRDCTFVGADFTDADLSGSSFHGCNFSNATLERADLSNTDLSWVNGLGSRQLRKAKISSSTKLPGITSSLSQKAS